MQILDDLYNETKRLFIAGSKFAKGDPRISKFIPILEKMGEKAPIMKKLSEKYTVLVEQGEPESLAEAGMFLYAVMSTQGDTEVSGEIKEQQPFLYELPKTVAPHSRLKPILSAFELSQQGRYEVIKSAYEDGFLNDFRLFEPITRGLDDKYSLLADYVYETVIPAIGAPLIPYILELYNPKGKRGDAMRLSLLHKIGYEEVNKLAFKAIEEGDTLVAAEAIKIIGENPENEEYLIKLANDKKAAIREAALTALTMLDSSQGNELIVKTLQSSKYKGAIQAAKICKDPVCIEKMLELVKLHYNRLFEDDISDKDFVEANNKFLELLSTLENKDSQDIYEFLSNILKNEDYYKRLNKNKHSGIFNNAQSLICDSLIPKMPEDKALEICENTITLKLAKRSPRIIAYHFRLASKYYTPERIFDVFSKYYESGVIRFTEMFSGLLNKDKGYYNISHEIEAKKIRTGIDSRWKKMFIKKKDMIAISAMICSGDECEQEMKDVILKHAKECISKKTANMELGFAIDRLAKMAATDKAELNKVAEICYEVFEKVDGYGVIYFYGGLSKENFLRLFYPDYSEKFKVLLKKKTSYIFKQINEVLQEAEIPKIISN